MKDMILAIVEGNVEHFNTVQGMSIEDFLIKADEYTRRIKNQIEQQRKLDKNG